MYGALEKLKEAVSKNELEKYLQGEKPYTVELFYKDPCYGGAPTDWSKVLHRGIFPLYEEDQSFLALYERTLIEQTNSIEGIFTDLHLLHLHIINEISKKSPFILEKEKLCLAIRAGIEKQEEKLKKDKRWSGYMFKDGLWGWIKARCRFIKKQYKIDILNEARKKFLGLF